MPKLRAHNISMSLDGYAAGPAQDIDNPLGVGGEQLHEWLFATRSGRRMIGEDGGQDGPDDAFFRAGEENIGATVMGRNMFGPIRGDWGDEDWTGWWGDNPPFHHPVFVLTRHPRPSVVMQGGTVFHFVTQGVESALAHAFGAANGRDVRLGGGAATIRQCMRAGLLDELHVAVVPILLGGGERLLDDAEGYRVAQWTPTASVAHVRLVKV